MSSREPKLMHPKPDPMKSRDLVGYGEFLPDPDFNLNVEGGSELSLANGDQGSEGNLNDIGAAAKPGMRAPLVESSFEFGSRRGVWRVLNVFDDFDIKISILAVARALEQNPELAHAFVDRGHEVVSHGYRWIDYCFVSEDDERRHIQLAIDSLTKLTGSRPVGWMTGRPSSNTRRLLVEAGGFLYDRDSLADELPYWLTVEGNPHLVIPYSYETNDNRFNSNIGFSTGEQFFTYMRDAFDVLRQEGAQGSPKLLSIGLHDRLIGRPGRCAGLIKLLEYMRKFDDVWFCTGLDVANHWRQRFPPSL
jgi:allantoinase